MAGLCLDAARHVDEPAFTDSPTLSVYTLTVDGPRRASSSECHRNLTLHVETFRISFGYTVSAASEAQFEPTQEGTQFVSKKETPFARFVRLFPPVFLLRRSPYLSHLMRLDTRKPFSAAVLCIVKKKGGGEAKEKDKNAPYKWAFSKNTFLSISVQILFSTAALVGFELPSRLEVFTPFLCFRLFIIFLHGHTSIIGLL